MMRPHVYKNICFEFKRLLDMYIVYIAHHAARLRILLTALDAVKEIKNLNVPAQNLHTLKGNLKGHWSLTVNANCRIIFIFVDEDVYLVDYQDYH